MFVKGYHPSDAMSLCSAAMERAAPFFLGALAAIGFAPFGIWPATIIALVLLFRTIGSASSVREVIGKSWWFGFGLGMASLPWLAQAFTFQSSMPPWLGWAAVALLAAYTALYWAMPLGFAFLVSRRSSPLIFAMQASAAFMVGEWLRGIILTGFPWNPLAAIWSDVPALVRGAAVIGSLGLSGATILLTALIAAAAGRGGARPPLVLTTVIALALLAIAVMPPLPDTDIPITLIQADTRQSDKWQPGATRTQLARYVALSSEPLAHQPRLLFWPEAAITVPLDVSPAARRMAATALGPGDLLFTGAVGTDPGGGSTNSVFVLDSAGAIRARYNKSHLVPFGEYLPFEKILGRLGATRLVPGNEDFIHGPGPRTLALGSLRFGVSICYEIAFPASVVDRSKRPQFLFNPSNDAWFGWGGAQQDLAQARLRAIEEGLPVIRATSTGLTAVIRADGSIAAHLPGDLAGRLNAFLPAARLPTPFSRWGSIIPLGGALVIALFSVALQCLSRDPNQCYSFSRRNRV